MSGAASVTLDIGPGHGALVIYPAERYRTGEIEISRVGHSRRVHTGVHERATGAGPTLTAIFGRLPAGEYDVWSAADARGPRVRISAGTVAELALP